MMKQGGANSTRAENHIYVDLPCRKKSLARARTKIVQFAAEHGFADSAEDIALAVQEALKNVIQHACPADDTMHLECTVTPDAFVCEIADQGMGFDVTALDNSPSTPMDVHGRGFQLIRGLMDGVTITSDQEGTVVRMEKLR